MKMWEIPYTLDTLIVLPILHQIFYQESLQKSLYAILREPQITRKDDNILTYLCYVKVDSTVSSKKLSLSCSFI